MKDLHPEMGSEIIDRITIKATEGLIQIISSRWGINEMLRVIDGLYRSGEIDYSGLQRIAATISERIEHNNREGNFYFTEVDRQIVNVSSVLIPWFGISADDALHFCTALLYKCKVFVTADHKLTNKINNNLKIAVFDLTNKEESEDLATLLELD